jgi:hypothetical protein
MEMTSSKRLSVLASLALTAVALLAPSAADAKHAPKARSFSGTVASVARDRRTFRIRRTSRASVLFRVGHGLKRGKGAHLARGQALDVRARRIKGRWVASRIARSAATEDEDTAGDDPGADEPDEDLSDDTGDDGADDLGDLLDPDDDLGDLLDPEEP